MDARTNNDDNGKGGGADRFLKKEEVAEMLGVSTRTVARLREHGQLKAVRIGRSVRFRQTVVLKYMNGLDK